MDLGLQEKRALVLAASRGLGYACALGLAKEGCSVVMCSRDQDRIEKAAEQIRQATGSRVVAVAADVSREVHVRRLVDTCVRELGGLETRCIMRVDRLPASSSRLWWCSWLRRRRATSRAPCLW